jgi:Rieske Fe-S protein
MPDPARPVATPDTGPNRRAVVVGAAAAAVGAGLLAVGCASTRTDPPADTGAAASSEPAAATPGALGPASEVPVGSAKIYPERQVVVTQAEPGRFVGLSTTCPHRGCAVATVSGATIICPCHRSTFGLDGSVISGPAPRGLAPREVTVDGDQLSLA